MLAVQEHHQGQIKRKAASIVSKFMPFCSSHAKAKQAALYHVRELRAQFEREFKTDYTEDSEFAWEYKMSLFDYLEKSIKAL